MDPKGWEDGGSYWVKEKQSSIQNRSLWSGCYCIFFSCPWTACNEALQKSRFMHGNGQVFILFDFLGTSSYVKMKRWKWAHLLVLKGEGKVLGRISFFLSFLKIACIRLCAPMCLSKMLELQLPDVSEKANVLWSLYNLFVLFVSVGELLKCQVSSLLVVELSNMVNLPLWI